MQNFKHKVQSQSGASMLMALFLLLVVTVVSVVILVSATSAAHQVRDNRAAQQAYLTVSSAADLLVQAFAKQSYTYTLTTYTRSDDPTITQTKENESKPESMLQETLLAASRAVRLHDGTPSERVFSRSAKLSLTTTGAQMEPVQAVFQLSYQSSGGESHYEMLVRLELADTAETRAGLSHGASHTDQQDADGGEQGQHNGGNRRGNAYHLGGDGQHHRGGMAAGENDKGVAGCKSLRDNRGRPSLRRWFPCSSRSSAFPCWRLPCWLRRGSTRRSGAS